MTRTHSNRSTGERASLGGLGAQSSRVIEDVAELGRTAMSSVTDTASELRDRGVAAWDAGVKGATRAKTNFDHAVAAHPMKSGLAALGIGAALGYALHRRG